MYELLSQNIKLNCNNSNINVLVLGAGNINIIWYMQIKDTDLNIIVIDKDANRISEVFFNEYPELKKYNISFYQTEIDTADFVKCLSEKALYSQYIAVSLGDDGLNINSVIFLKKYFIRKNVADEKHFFIRIKNKQKGRSIKKLFDSD